MNIELKPCPFCGGDAEMIDVNAYISARKRTIYRVECKKGIECPGMPGTHGYDTEREAAAAWNTRAYEEDGRKTGKWITEEIGLMSYATKCSVCGTTLHEGHGFGNAKEYTEYIDEFCMLDKFCHECGTKMEADG